MHVGIERKCMLPCYGLSSALGLVSSSSRQPCVLCYWTRKVFWDTPIGQMVFIGNFRRQLARELLVVSRY